MEIDPTAYDKYQDLLDAQLKDAIWGEKGKGYYVHKWLVGPFSGQERRLDDF